MGKWIGVIVVLIIVLGIGYIWMVKAKSGSSYPKDFHAKDVSLLGRAHVKVGTKVDYSSNPPTSGDHYAEWTKNGAHDKPTADGHLVHSLEHGYIIISHNCEIKSQMSKTDGEATQSANLKKECEEFVDQLEDLVKSDSWKMILIPRPSLDTNFALTAWGKIDKFNIKDATLDRVKTFKEAFRNQGPEQTME